MPLYTFECLSGCEGFEDQWLHIDDLPSAKCNRCGGPVRQRIGGHSVHVFQPRVYEHITTKPLYIESKKQLKQACEEHGCYSRYLLDS